LAKTEANVADAVMLTRIWQQGREWLSDNATWKSQDILQDYLKHAASRPFAREDVGRLVEFALAEDYYGFREAVLALLEEQLQRDVRDPLFLLHRFRLHQALFGPGRAEERAELEAILAEAGRRKDDATARQARKLLDALNTAPPPPPFPLEEDFEDDFNEQEPPDFEGEFPTPEELFAGMPAAQREMVEEFMEMVAQASEKELKLLKRTKPPGMSAREFDLLIDIARAVRSRPGGNLPPSGFPFPKPPPLKPPKPPKPLPRPDPNQPDLF
jgi:hypothetical protein